MAFLGRPSRSRRSLSAGPRTPLTPSVYLPARHLVDCAVFNRALCPATGPTDARHVPRAPSPLQGVTPSRVAFLATWEGVTPPSSLLRAHAPNQIPPTSFGVGLVRWVFAGCCQPLLGVGPSRRYLHNPCIGAWTLTPRCPFGALARFFPKDLGLTLDLRRSAHRVTPALQLQQVTFFGAAVIPLCSGSHAR